MSLLSTFSSFTTSFTGVDSFVSGSSLVFAFQSMIGLNTFKHSSPSFGGDGESPNDSNEVLYDISTIEK